MNKEYNEEASLKLTILSIMGDMNFKDNKERFEFAQWSMTFLESSKRVPATPLKVVSTEGMN